MIILSNRELEIMSIIWKKHIISSDEIIEILTSKKWKIRTINKFIKKLLNKKVITIYKQRDAQFIYKVNIDAQTYANNILKKYPDILLF